MPSPSWTSRLLAGVTRSVCVFGLTGSALSSSSSSFKVKATAVAAAAAVTLAVHFLDALLSASTSVDGGNSAVAASETPCLSLSLSLSAPVFQSPSSH